jgi:enoyl-CoA hydratase
MSNEFVSLNREGSVSIITMDDGKANAFSSAMIAAFNGCLNDVPKDSGALVITGRANIFSGGFDLKTIESGDEEARKLMSIGGLTLLADIFSFPRPVVIACNGHAVALGAFFLLSADYRIGADGDFRIWANEIGNGMTIPKAVLEITKIRIDQSHWFRAILHSEPYPIQEAIAPGYLDEVVPQETLMDAALAKAEDLAKLGHPFYSITKEWAQAEVLQRIRSTIG